MTITEKIFALRRSEPFDRLRDSELTIIAEVTQERQYSPGETIISSEKSLQNLYIVVQGSVQNSGGNTVPHVFGIKSLLFNVPLTSLLNASPEEGAVCLLIGKGHFFGIRRKFG